jgi:Zn finger protein HypA/HybF involved in hydrogenase expression
VREEELGVVQAQQMYQMRCECGRSWFELVLKQFVQCPACHKLGLVSADQSGTEAAASRERG